ncbi:ceramide transfer protein isoform X1 [Drosophila grimshawi]|uniref:Ceramide transfer protein n=1 Tax=Drosophila grimshawi TaxID=7222 RepID=B4J205_DROGR|nr:ceramide transfer protein isoform X1 [Drosophila grimshawi]XP_032596383.1 ceramide transfer protein isoform X1 [Drosophila grimshawi]EDV95930.1 GH15976 [Drosophila grimshawi]
MADLDNKADSMPPIDAMAPIAASLAAAIPAPAGSTSDTSEEEEYLDNSIELRGYLSKWTNYIYGWQPRYIVLKDGTLSYYKSESESDLGCRGAISLSKATIKAHESDELRFDVVVNNLNNWCLRAETSEDRMHWVEVLQLYKEGTGSTDTTSLRRHGSTMSLQSNTISLASGGSLKKTQRNLREKVGELETFKDILFIQIETLQRYFDACSELNKSNAQPLDLGDGLKPIDFKGESITFRATTAGVLSTLQHCLEIIAENDESWKRRLEREIDKRRRTDEQNRKFKEEIEKLKRLSYPGPDFEEGPHSTLPEDEFFDAVETGLEKIEEDMQIRFKLRLQSQISQTLVNVPHEAVAEGEEAREEFGTGAEAKTHALWPEIDRVCKEQLHYAREGVGQDGNGWQIFADEGEIKMYKREEEVNGMVMDPLKAYHSVKGVTAREMCHYFFMPEFRNDWETTLEDCTILEKISADTLLFLQTHKRIWPASQRDAQFWSHMRKINDGLDPDTRDMWVVCNNSTEYAKQDSKNGKCVRIFLTVILACQTLLPDDYVKGQPLNRDDLTCKVTYCSVVNPGGWAPASALRAVYKREYPKFLKRFTGYVIDQCKDKPIMF